MDTRESPVQEILQHCMLEGRSGPSIKIAVGMIFKHKERSRQTTSIKMTVNVQTMEITELSGLLAPLLKIDLIHAMEAFREVVLADQSR